MLKDFLCGLSYIFRGCRAFYGDRGAWKYALGALFLLLLFYSAMFSGCIYLAKTISAHLQNISLPAWLSWMSGCINGISLGLLVIIFLLLLVVTFKSFFEIAAEFFFDRMLAYYEKKKFGLEPVPQSISQQFKQTAGGLSDAIKTLILSLFMLLLSLVLPFIGQILFVVILGTRTGVSYLYAPAFNRGLTRRQTKDVYAGKNIVRGFGITALLLQFIPFVSPFLLPALVLGGAELFHHEFKEEV